MTSAIDPVTLHFILSGINVLSECHFTYSPKMKQEQNFRKSLIISFGQSCD